MPKILYMSDARLKFNGDLAETRKICDSKQCWNDHLVVVVPWVGMPGRDLAKRKNHGSCRVMLGLWFNILTACILQMGRGSQGIA